MSDLFHKDVPVSYIKKIFEVMRRAHWHRFQVLTERLLELDNRLDWPSNVLMGVSVEIRRFADRIDHLRRTHATVKFISFEPLLEALGELDLSGIDWAIVGGESGPKARLMEETWVVEIRDQCQDMGIPFFFKQWGGVNKKRAGRLLEGRIWDQVPII